MILAVAVFLLLLCGWQLWALWVGALGRGTRGPQDRFGLLSLALEAALVLFLARIVVPWTPPTSWGWSLLVAVLGGGTAMGALRAVHLPWVAAGSASALRRRRVLAPFYAVVLTVANAAAYASLL